MKHLKRNFVWILLVWSPKRLYVLFLYWWEFYDCRHCSA